MSSINSSRPQQRIALVDGNNFYMSCERVFQPALLGKPVVVLSNNDGCIVSRSQEAKDLGIRMGLPFFQITPAMRRQGLIARSSNYPLYADLSDRLMRLLGEVTPQQEVYSIDECFIDLSHLPDGEIDGMAGQLRQKVLQWIGIPTCIGIGPSKTLAKLANHVAKKNSRLNGIFDWAQLSAVDADHLLKTLPVGEVWGVGRRLREQLDGMGIRTVLDLKRGNREMLRQRFSVVLARTVDELNGESCLALTEVADDKQQIMTSRSFAQAVTEKAVLASAIADFATRSAAKLRQQGGLANAVHVFAWTDRFADAPQCQSALTIPLSVPTSDTLRICRAALYGLAHFYDAAFAYKKAGVMLLGLESCGQRQGELFSRFDESRSAQLMSVLDKVNARFGAQTLRPALVGGAHAWSSRQENRSGSFTTSWLDLPPAYC